MQLLTQFSKCVNEAVTQDYSTYRLGVSSCSVGISSGIFWVLLEKLGKIFQSRSPVSIIQEVLCD